MSTANSFIFIDFSLVLIRFLGMVVFIDFYRKGRDVKFILLIFGTLTSIIAPIIDLLNENTIQIEVYLFLDFLSELFISITEILFFYVFIQYISNQISFKTLLIMLSAVISLTVLYPILGFEISVILLQIINFIVISTGTILVLKNWHVLKQIAENSGYFLIMTGLVIIFSIIVTVLVIIVNSPELTFIQYLLSITLSFMSTFVFVQLEFNKLSIQSNKMKDEYSHSLTQLVQASMGQFELLLLTKNEEERKECSISGLRYCQQIGELISKIRRI